MYIRALQICFAFCILKESLSSQNIVNLELNFDGDKCSFKYNCLAPSSYYCLTGSADIVDSKCEQNSLNKTSETAKIEFFNKCIAQHLENVELDTPNYMPNCTQMQLSSLINLKQLTWNLGECQAVNRVMEQIKDLEKLTIYLTDDQKAFNDCSELHNLKHRNLKELQIFAKIIKKNSTLSINRTFLNGLRSLESFKLSASDSNNYVEIDIDKEVFNGLTNLTEIVIENAGKTTLEREHFKNLTNLKTLRLRELRIDQCDWLSSPTLQHHLERLELNHVHLPNCDLNGTMMQLKQYKKLTVLQVPDRITLAEIAADHNLTTFICDYNNTCQFISDINGRKCPAECNCSLILKEMRFHIDCHKSQEIPKLPIPITRNASLDLSNQNLTILPNRTLYGYAEVRELHLANNTLSNLTIEQLPKILTNLDLSGNRFQTLDKKVLQFFTKQSNSLRLKLSGNPWICSCANQNLARLISTHNGIVDRTSINCTYPGSGETVNMFNLDLCDSTLSLIGFVLSATIVTTLLILYLWKKIMFAKIYYYFPKLAPVEGHIRHDAFVAFSHLNSNLIPEYLDELENKKFKYKLCFYQRDWLIGSAITQCILDSIDKSRAIIILMTKEFVNSTWGRLEFRSAIKATAENKYLLIILYPGVDINKLDSELKLYMKYFIYHKRDDPDFWNKLRKSMPPKPKAKFLC